MTRRHFVAGLAAGASAAGAPSSAMGFSPDCFGIARAPRTPLEYLEYSHQRGAGGVQVMLSSFEPELLKRLRERTEQYRMYLELTTALPTPEDSSRFENTVKAVRECGARAIRSVCLSGRRYETFSTLEEWRRFVGLSKERLARAVRIVDAYKVPLGIENHKDWTIEEMVPLLKSYSSEYLGACIDWGNNMSLLDDPMELAEALAPFAVNSHIKDMAVEESADGFLLSEVALGEGMLDLKRMLATIRNARPNARFSLDMLTRDPLRIPCLTGKYWATFPERNGRYLARTLSMVRANKPRQPLPRVTAMSQEERLKLEQDNVARSVAFARDSLGLA